MKITKLFTTLFISALVIALHGCGGGGGEDKGPDTAPAVVDGEYSYFPENLEATWIYDDNNGYERTLWLEDSGAINGYQSYSISRDGDGKIEEYYVSGDSGIYLAGLKFPVFIAYTNGSVEEYSAKVIFDEKLALLTEEMIEDFAKGDYDSFITYGRVNISPDYGNHDVMVSVLHMYNGDDYISYNDLETKNIRLNLILSVDIDGYEIQKTIDYDIQFAENIGIAGLEIQDEYGSESYELIEYSAE
ncbi:MAG: hypothetical protein D6B27_09770 [Gammaproteobacteria bacterium]|nr:MAG: hypothetical protein D6B27_09770 [Gammaproteobacteria bacterium]